MIVIYDRDTLWIEVFLNYKWWVIACAEAQILRNLVFIGEVI